MMKTSDYADLMYRDQGKVSHIVPFGVDRALCGMFPGSMITPGRDAWFGTGSWDEYETAAALPLCVLCDEKAGGTS